MLASKDAADSGAELHREVEIFVTATVVLTGCTLAATFWWEKLERRLAALRVA